MMVQLAGAGRRQFCSQSISSTPPPTTFGVLRSQQQHVSSSSSYKRFLSSTSSKQASTSSSTTTSSQSINTTKQQLKDGARGGSHNNISSSSSSSSNASTKYFTTKTNQDIIPPTTTTIENELSQLRSEIATLSYLIKQTSSQQVETQALARRAEARAYIIENKLMDIQSHVVKIPANIENLVHNTQRIFKEYSPSYVSEAIRKVNELSSGTSLLTNKYTLWTMFVAIIVFWQYRLTMYQRTSEEVAEVAALTLQQDSLRRTIQETLTTVANSPETLDSLSALFQKLITEKHTEEHLINLIVRALNSEGVRDAAIYLLDVAFRNDELQCRAGEFLKVAANATVLDEGVQKNAGKETSSFFFYYSFVLYATIVHTKSFYTQHKLLLPLIFIGIGIQHALKSAVVPWWAKKIQHSRDHHQHSSSTGIEEKDHDDDHNIEKDVAEDDADSMNDIVVESKDEVSSLHNRSLATESDIAVDTVV